MLCEMYQSEFEDLLLTDENANWTRNQAVLLWDYCLTCFDDLFNSGCDLQAFYDRCRELTCRVAIRCEWNGYTDPQDYYVQHREYDSSLPDPLYFADNEEWQSELMEYLTDNKIVLWSGSIGDEFVVAA